jgi:hypothetical protein
MQIKLQLGNGDVIELAPNDVDAGSLTLAQATEIAGGYIFNQYVTLPGYPAGGLSGAHSVQGLAETSVIWGNATCSYLRDGNDRAQIGYWYCGGVNGSHAASGDNYNIYGVRIVVESVTFYGVGFDTYPGTQFLACLISEGAIGRSGFIGQGGDETPPNAGADAGAGWGTYDYSSQYVKGSAVPLDPPLPVSDTGYGYHAYLLSSSAFSEFGRRLWGVGDANDGLAITSDLWQKWQNYRFSPMAGIISCIRLPAELTPTPPSTADAAIRIAGTVIPMFGQSIAGCQIINPAPTTHVVLDVQLPETYASWLDFEGVDITLVLPFVGRVPIDPSACVGGIGRVRVVYQCDAMTGNLAAMVYVWDRWSQNASDYQLYTVATGNSAVQVPLVGHADGQVQMLGTLAADALAAGASAAVGNPIGVAGAALSATSALMMRREQTQTIGTYAGSVSYISSTTAYMIITKPQPTSSPHYDHTHGRPCDYGAKIGEYSGFNQFYDVDVNLLSECTPEDRQEINRLLQGGVIL